MQICVVSQYEFYVYHLIYFCVPVFTGSLYG